MSLTSLGNGALRLKSTAWTYRAMTCRPASATTRSTASSAKAAWASCTRRATSGCERTVALKTMSSLGQRRDGAASGSGARRAPRRASTIPTSARSTRSAKTAAQLFIAMELLEGEALAERLRRGPLSVAEALPIGLGMLAALAALHARGIVHRDLKPSNVFLTAHGVKLLDFGLARPELEPVARHGATELTRTGMRDGHAALHGARAGHRRGRRRPQRSLRRRRDPVRDARRPSGVRRPHRRRDPARHAATSSRRRSPVRRRSRRWTA